MYKHDHYLYRADPDADAISPQHDTLVRIVESTHSLWPFYGGRFDALRKGYGDRADRPVAVKGARWRVKNGTDGDRQVYAHGRFALDADEHAALLDEDGLYAFIVYESHPKGIIPLYSRMLSAAIVDDYLDPDTRIAWPEILTNTGAEL